MAGVKRNRIITASYLKRFITDNGLDVKAKYAVAVSGGADSMVLLHIAVKAHLNVMALHCNFHLRGKESDGDEDFVRRRCKEYGVELATTDFDTIQYANATHTSIEMAARDLRYKWFDKIMAENGVAYLLVAHHGDDLVETVLINYTRGTGINGLSGIKKINGKIIRPLLAFSKDDILHFTQAHGLDFRTDSTNSDTAYTRNLIRHEIIPVLKKINPSFIQTAYENSQKIIESNKLASYALEMLKAKVCSIKDETLIIDIKEVMDSPSPETLVYSIVSAYGFNPTQCSNITDTSLSNSGKVFESPTHILSRERESWVITPIKQGGGSSLIINGPGTYNYGGRSFTIENISINSISDVSKDASSLTIDTQAANFPLMFRRFKAGDYFYPFGKQKIRKKVSNLFSDLKLDRNDKENLIILCDAATPETIIWIAGYRSDIRFCVTNETKNAICMKMH